MSLINNILKVFVGDKNRKDLKLLEPIIKKVLAHQDEIDKLSDDQLRAKTPEFKKIIADSVKPYEDKISSLNKEIEDADIDRKEDIYLEIDKLEDESYLASEKALLSLMPEGFAVLRETARRFKDKNTIEVTANDFDLEISNKKSYVDVDKGKAVWSTSWDASGTPVSWDMVHYDVQLIGGSVLHQGKIAEMMTGEGKTLVATLPIYLNALSGKGVHVVTVNDYLAKRDSAWMGPIFEFHGLSIDCIDYYQPNSEERKKAYNADITYGTNNEFGFDYLRDNMSHSPDSLVQRKHNYAIIDEVDSVLIDDARTPLIISGPTSQEDKHEFDELKPVVDEIIDIQKKYLIGVLAEAKKKIKNGDTKEGGKLLLQVYRGLPKNKSLIKFLSQEGMRLLLQKTENFHMQDNNRQMHIIDNELYFVIEEKSKSVELSDKGIKFLSESQNNSDDFFILPDLGMEISKIDKMNLSIEDTESNKEELYRNFSIKSERIHTLNQLLKAYTLFEKNIDYVVMDSQVKIVDEQTGRIMDGRRYSDGLHQAIEARENVKIEASTQTYATVTLQNYFRMYRKLSGMTGTAITEAGELWQIYKLDVIVIPTNLPIARDDKDDLIFKSAREKYNSIIKDIEALVDKKRPVLVGTTSVEISELLSKMLSLRKIKHNVLNAKLHKKEADIVAEAGQPGIVTIATNMAGRGTDIKLTKEVKGSGGLAIIGTERHDSRRVDRQLRGRAGRQGDVGSSQFYVSLEDSLMRLFGSERIAKMMDRLGIKEGEVIQHSMISKSIERAQKKVEENNFGVRKRLLEYDDVMNAQREVIYKRRRHALYGERLQVDIVNMTYDICVELVNESKSVNDYKHLEFEMIRFSSTALPFSDKEFKEKTAEDLIDLLFKAVYTHYKVKMEANASSAFPLIEHVYKTQGEKFIKIAVPFSDGNKSISVVTDLEKAYESKCLSLINDFEKSISLAIIDESWKNHLRQMDELKQTVQNATYEQKDPLLIYKFESFELFRNSLDEINKEILCFLFKGALPDRKDSNQIQQAKDKPKEQQLEEHKTNFDESIRNNRQAANNFQGGGNQKPETIVRAEKKIGRNDIVTIKNIKTSETRDVKFKQASLLIREGSWILLDKSWV